MAAAADHTGGTRRGMTWPQAVALVFGVVYLLIGIIGFFITGFGNFFGNASGSTPEHMHTLLGFMINPLHNVVHVVIGVIGLALFRTLAGARTYGWLLTVGYGAAFIYGLFAVGKHWDVLNLNWADNILHLATAVVGLVIALGPLRRAVGNHAAANA